MWRAWATYLLLLGVSRAINKPSGLDAVQSMIQKENISASSTIEDHHSLIDWRDDKGWSLMHYAALHGYTDVINILVKAGATVDLKDFTGLTPLMLAVKGERKEALDALLKYGADVSATDKAGIGMVARATSGSLLQVLLTAGADLDLRDSSGTTAVMLWAREGRVDMLMAALQHCPDLTLANHHGLTALDMAKISNNTKPAKVIEDKLKAMCVADDTYFPLHHTRYEGCNEVSCEAKCQWVRTGNTDPNCNGINDSNGTSRQKRGARKHNSKPSTKTIDPKGKVIITLSQTVRQAKCP